MRFVWLLLLVSACGVQGDLYLPEQQKPNAPMPNSAPVEVEADDDWSNPQDDNFLDDNRI